MSLSILKSKKRLGGLRQRYTENKAKIFTLHNLWTCALFVAFSFVVAVVCFLGQTPASFQVLPDQVAHFRINADVPFSYESRILTKRLKEDKKDEVARIYSVQPAVHERALKDLEEIAQRINVLDENYESLSEDDKHAAIEQAIKAFSEDLGIPLNTTDTNYILSNTNPEQREEIFEEVRIIFGELYNEGVYEETVGTRYKGGDQPYFVGIQVAGRGQQAQVHSEPEAKRILYTNLRSLDINLRLANALQRILRNLVIPNLAFDSGKTNERIEEVIAEIQPVVIEVEQGTTIIEANRKVSPEEYEMLNAYRRFVAEHSEYDFQSGDTFLERFLISMGIFLCVLIYMKAGMRRFFESKRRVALSAVVLVLNLALIRIVLALGSTTIFAKHAEWIPLLPAMLPLLLTPIIVTLMVGGVPAAMLAVIQSVFLSMMLGNAVQYMLVAILSSLIAIYACRNIRLRSGVVRAGLIGGLTWGACLMLVSLFYETQWNIVGTQFGLSVVAGIACGIFTVGMLPFLEDVFKITTDISLLELTDFNHPLLQKLQMTAPGTFHHSLMVAMLSERAARAIGANALMCRACAIFHDIGKMIKPEYFVENQSGGVNPHNHCSPSMSALVIKSHVKEGVNIAKEEKLPQVIIDVIEQHHGTSLIEYFYHKAKEEAQKAKEEGGDGAEADLVEESTFRYEGPRPRSKESAIISLADCLEASSRTLSKVSPQSIEELIDKLFAKRLEDHQLDMCHLTFAELTTLKETFARALLNTLHSRIKYPDQEQEQAALKQTMRPDNG